jgi:phosphate starvation-inducible PhoH-like protein
MSKKQLDEKSIQKNHFDYNFEISKKFKLRDSHRSFVELGVLKDTNMMFIDGPAGSAKTYCAAYLGLNMLKTRAVDEIIYIRSIIESASKSMGSLPGEIDDKFYPWSIPLKEKLDELLVPGVSSMLFDTGHVRAIPVNYVRGLTFARSFVIIDEAQNLTRSELVTIMTRFGEDSKMIIIGDTKQSDINGKSGFREIYNTFNDKQSEEQHIYCFKFTEQDIVRSELLKFIVKKLSAGD